MGPAFCSRERDIIILYEQLLIIYVIKNVSDDSRIGVFFGLSLVNGHIIVIQYGHGAPAYMYN